MELVVWQAVFTSRAGAACRMGLVGAFRPDGPPGYRDAWHHAVAVKVRPPIIDATVRLGLVAGSGVVLGDGFNCLRDDREWLLIDDHSR